MKKRIVFWALLPIIFLSFACFFTWDHFSGETLYHEHFPIKFTSADLPCMEVTIENEGYPFVVDLGSKFHTELDKVTLDRLQKKPNGMASWVNIKSIKYTLPQFILPQISLKSIVIHDVKVVETSHIQDNTLWSPPDNEKLMGRVEPVGFLGKPLFEKLNLLLDLHHSIIVISNQKDQLEKEGYHIHSYIKVPIELTKKHVIVNAETELGPVRLVLDSGATWTIIKNSTLKEKSYSGTEHGLPIFISSFFKMGGCDFGKKKIHFYSFPKEAGSIDGVLGVDFLKEHIVYIDFKHKTAYISKDVTLQGAEQL